MHAAAPQQLVLNIQPELRLRAQRFVAAALAQLAKAAVKPAIGPIVRQRAQIDAGLL